MESDFIQLLNQIILPATVDTIYMVFWSSLFAVIFGIFSGVILYITAKDGIMPILWLHKILDVIVNIGRSIPFIILILAIFPLSKVIVGTTIGSKAAIVPLTIASIPFVARVIQNALLELDKGIIEAAMSFGASKIEIIFKVLLPESAPSIINGITLTIISIIGYSAMAGSIGGGGLGDVAVRYGFYRNRLDVLYATIVIMVILVQIVQVVGNIISKKLDKR